jgi:DNA repair and recombination RAD54-like protein
MMQIQNDMSTTVNDFILRRVNTLNAQHLPPKLVQVVCCNLTEIQQNMYQHLINSKDMQHVLDGKQVNCLASIQMLMKLCNHPSLVADEDPAARNAPAGMSNKRAPSGRSTNKQVKYSEDDKETTAAPGADGIAKFLPYVPSGRGDMSLVHPEWYVNRGCRADFAERPSAPCLVLTRPGARRSSHHRRSGKMYVLYRLMKEMRKPGNGNDKIVIVSNYTQTLDLIGRMCRESNWGFCRLDGSIGMKKRQKMVDDFNDPSSSLIAFLLSSKAGGWYVGYPSRTSLCFSGHSGLTDRSIAPCYSGLNLIGGNRLVLFDPDWNPGTLAVGWIS